MFVLLWFNSILLVCVLKNQMISANENFEMECFVCNSLLGDSCYDSKELNLSTFTKKCSDYVEVMPNCMYHEEYILLEPASDSSVGKMVMSTLSEGLDGNTNIPISEKPVYDYTSRHSSDGPNTSGYQLSMNGTTNHPNFSDIKNSGNGTVMKDVGLTTSSHERKNHIRWPKENPFNEQSKSARVSTFYFCYKLVVVARDGEQYTIRGCTRKARACFTGNFRAVHHYDCFICEGTLCNAQTTISIFMSLSMLLGTQVILLSKN